MTEMTIFAMAIIELRSTIIFYVIAFLLAETTKGVVTVKCYQY